MEKLIEFVGNNYAWFLTITILLLFALIGYIYDGKRNKSDLVKKQEEEIDEIALESIVANSEDNKSLGDMVSHSKNINPETKSLELNDNTILNNGPVNNQVNSDVIDNLMDDNTINQNINN